MKKVIFGTGLLICGALGVLISYLAEKAIPLLYVGCYEPNYLLPAIGIILFAGGFVLNILGFIEKDKKE